MDSLYRTLTSIALWLGIVAFVLAVVMLVLNQRFLFFLLPGGILRGAHALFLLAVAAYCAHRSIQGP